jgi:Big-like domain-containing protein/parallel beta helix pectate lyase-like protein
MTVMTFTHRLSRRLALLRATAAVAALAVMASCDILSLSDTSPLDLPQVVVVPGSATLEPDQTYQFSGYGRTKTGDSVAVAVVWSATGGTISSSGRYTADSLQGDYEVRATLAGANTAAPSSSSVVRVRKLAQLLVTPANVTLPTRGTKAFAAYGRLNGGDSVAVTVTWAARAGTIASTGIYTAGPTPGLDTVTATGRGFSAAASVTLTSIPVASVSASPPSATLSVGATQQLSAVTKDSAGGTLTGRVVTWSSSNPAVATVSASGLVTAIAAGSATITATSEGKNGTSAITVQAPPPVSHAGYYVAPSGSPTGNGSATQPWDLATALAHPSAVQPGDTIWLRGGTYTGGFVSRLTGTAGAPIMVRQYPGEVAIINAIGSPDPGLLVNGAWTWYWDFTLIGGAVGINAFGPNVKFINLIVHDSPGTGIGFWMPATNSEIYGCLIYNNGTVNNLDHGIYTQNNMGIKQIRDNIIFNNMAFGIHAYADKASLTGLVFDGNVSFTNGTIAGGEQKSGLFVGGGTPADNITVSNNMLYMSGNGGGNLWVGYTADVVNQDVIVTGNYVVGGFPAFRLWNWTTATVRDNTLYSPGAGLVYTLGATGGWTWTNQFYFRDPANTAWTHHPTTYSFANWRTQTGLGASDQTGPSTPTGIRVFVRRNAYERGRGHVIVYNWDRVSSVAVDVSTVLQVGDRYQVRNVENVFGAPVLSGTYQGGTLSFPMAAVAPPKPLVGSAPPATGPEFQAFLITRL